MGTIWQPELAQDVGPKYKAVIHAIRNGIADQTLSAGDKLPPVRDLAWTLGITPGTVARAYSSLTDDGTLIAEVGRGTFVATRNGPQPEDIPIEVDSAQHGVEAQSHDVNLISPHLPSMGQASLIRGLLGQIAQDPPSGLMHYPNRKNMRPAQAAVAEWLKSVPVGPLDAEDVVLAHGGQNAILLVLQSVLKGRRPVMLVEELSYPGFRRAAELLRAEVVPVAIDKHGIVPESLEAAARGHEAQILCTSAEVQNPTCVFTPRARRAEIVEIARRCDLQILEDDCYRVGPARAPSYRMLAPERSWYVASLSKLLTPALRVGFGVAPRGQTAVLRRAAEHSFFGLATPIADLVAALMSHPQIDRLLDSVRERSADYIQCAVNVLGGHDLTWREDVPFLWLVLPSGWRTSAFCRAASEQGIQVRPAEDFACRDANSPHAIRLAVNAGVGLENFEQAMQRLRVLLDNPVDAIGV